MEAVFAEVFHRFDSQRCSRVKHGTPVIKRVDAHARMRVPVMHTNGEAEVLSGRAGAAHRLANRLTFVTQSAQVAKSTAVEQWPGPAQGAWRKVLCSPHPEARKCVDLLGRRPALHVL
eukprot:15318532-Alexandrium_andersonii.AAC.1